MRGIARKPPKPEFTQLLSIPNREAVVAEFRRCAPISELINIELERITILSAGPALMLSAFIRDPKLTINHIILYRGKIDEADLLAGARMLAQNAERETLRRRQAKKMEGIPWPDRPI